MKQTTKFLHIVMCMALGLSVSLTSCKDYDDDIDGLNQRIDGVVSDLNSLKEIVNGLVKSVTYDETTGKLTVTPVTGEALIYSVGENVEVPEYELKKDGNAFWLEKDGVQTGDKVEVSIPEVDEFDPALLSVRMENGEYVVYYGDEPTQATIPVPANNSIVKNGNEITITIGEDKVTFTLAVGDALKSMVFEPQAYLNGVEAMKARYIETEDWDCITSDEKPTTTGEVWSTTNDKDQIKNLTIAAKVVARYHVNPSTVDLATIKAVNFITKNKEQVITKAANELGAKLIGEPELVKGENDEPMMQLTFSVDGEKLAAANSDEISVLAVQATVEDANAEEGEKQQLVTSDYAAIFNTTITDFRLASADIEKYVGDYNEGKGHLWSTAEAAIKGVNVNDVAPKVIPVLYDNSVKVKLEDYVVAHYTEIDYENEVLVGCCDKDKFFTRKELNALGLDIRFVASNYITGDNQTPQNEFFTVDEKTGEITTKVYSESGAASIGRMPLVRVELYNMEDPDQIASVGWIKLLIVRGTSEGTEEVCDFGNINWGCNAVDKKVSVEFMNTKIYNKLGLSKDDFHAIYTIDVTNEDGVGTIEEIVDEIADETNIVKWTISDAELKAAKDGDVLEAKVVYSAKGREDVVITLKATVQHPEPATVGDKIDEYWGNDGKDYVRLNVEVVDEQHNCNFATDLLNTFTGNKLTVKVDEDFTDFATLNYSFVFSDKNKDRKIKGLSGTEYTLSVSADGKTLYANGTTAVAVLSDGLDANSLVTYQDNAIAKDLLNRAAHDELGEATFYALMNVKATNSCGLEYPLVNNGEFKAFFLRPVDVVRLDNPAKLEDAKTNGSTIKVMDLIKLIDWRNENFAFEKPNFYEYYEVQQIVALAGDYADANYPVYTSLNGGDINKTKLEEVTTQLVLTATEGKPATYPASEEDLKNYGELTLRNNGAAVGKPFQLNVPVKVVYKWGEVIEYVLVDVTQTQGN